MRYGYIRKKEEIKFLILYVMGYLPFAVSFDSIMDICTWCDGGFDYFELTEAFAELIQTGHILENPENSKEYEITEKGKDTASLFEDHLPYTIRKEAQVYALKVVRKIRRNAGIHTRVERLDEHDLIVHLEMEDVFSLHMNVVNDRQASMLEQSFKKNAEKIYNDLLSSLTKDYTEEKDNFPDEEP